MLIVGEIVPSKLAPAQVELREVLNRRVSIVVFDDAEYRKHIADGDHFIATVLSQPRIWLFGAEPELNPSSGVPARKSRRAKAA